MLAQLRQTPRLTFENFKKIYDDYYQNISEPHPAWIPTPKDIQSTNLFRTMQQLKLPDFDAFYQWSITETEQFWDYIIKTLDVKFDVSYKKIWQFDNNIETLQWLPSAKLNIVDTCFKNDPNKTAIIYQDKNNDLANISYSELNTLVNRIANSIANRFSKGDMIAINMPMTVESIAIYLAIIKAGCVVVSIADSFASEEIATRLAITKSKAIFTQDYYIRNNKKITIYDRVISANAPLAIVISLDKKVSLRTNDILFDEFISPNTNFKSVVCNPSDYTNILFSSGTTGEPKAIPWTHTTPIKAGADAFFHQDVQPHDIVAWPTNLGWMMGPWLVYACFLNGATMALSNHAPTQVDFGKFIQDSKVSILGLVPSIVIAWKAAKSMENFDWSAIKCFSSSGECSAVDDYLYLMWLGNGKPIIEYCGGTEIGGAYISSTLIQPNSPGIFTTPTFGMDFVFISENQINHNAGEIALSTPSIGLSQVLLNRDHHKIYFANMPTYNGIVLRRHGDQFEKIAEHCYRAQGRVDDTMNLGGIKTSSAEIERILNNLQGIQETAAIAVQPKQGGPSQLVVYVICEKEMEKKELFYQFQQEIKNKLNPLFKLHDLIFVSEFPRTASNKIMRRILRNQYTLNFL